MFGSTEAKWMLPRNTIVHRLSLAVAMVSRPPRRTAVAIRDTMMTSNAAGRMRRARRSVEREKVDPFGRLALAKQQSGYDEAGDDEEDVDPDEAALCFGNAHMDEHDEHDRDRPETFDIRSKLTVLGRRARFLSARE